MAETTDMLFDNKIMLTAKADFEKDAADLKTKGTELISALTAALKTFEGATKDAVMVKVGSTGTKDEKSLAYFAETQVPQLLTNLATLLEANRATLQKGDKMLADQISGNAK